MATRVAPALNCKQRAPALSACSFPSELFLTCPRSPRPPTPPYPTSTSLGSVVRSYLEKRDQNGTDEMLIMPSNIEVKTAEEIMAQMGGGSPPQIVPNSVPIYHVEGLPASEDEASAGAEGAAPPAALSFFRFSDMRNRIESLKEALKANGTADAKPELRVRMMRLHELSQLTGTERMPGTRRLQRILLARCAAPQRGSIAARGPFVRLAGREAGGGSVSERAGLCSGGCRCCRPSRPARLRLRAVCSAQAPRGMRRGEGTFCLA